jgi:hypothetical protein
MIAFKDVSPTKPEESLTSIKEERNGEIAVMELEDEVNEPKNTIDSAKLNGAIHNKDGYTNTEESAKDIYFNDDLTCPHGNYLIYLISSLMDYVIIFRQLNV